MDYVALLLQVKRSNRERERTPNLLVVRIHNEYVVHDRLIEGIEGQDRTISPIASDALWLFPQTRVTYDMDAEPYMTCCEGEMRSFTYYHDQIA